MAHTFPSRNPIQSQIRTDTGKLVRWIGDQVEAVHFNSFCVVFAEFSLNFAPANQLLRTRSYSRLPPPRLFFLHQANDDQGEEIATIHLFPKEVDNSNKLSHNFYISYRKLLVNRGFRRLM